MSSQSDRVMLPFGTNCTADCCTERKEGHKHCSKCHIELKLGKGKHLNSTIKRHLSSKRHTGETDRRRRVVIPIEGQEQEEQNSEISLSERASNVSSEPDCDQKRNTLISEGT